ncbi:hypothetical protein [Pontibacter indicus]|uniref:hypothetical protein n=1 Tax=Pontibacter indicus TaxID=1317125 RepID=UPI0011156197|nr:hypothetical protein [Pontibacter indicus]
MAQALSYGAQRLLSYNYTLYFGMPADKNYTAQGMNTASHLFCHRAVFGLGSRPIFRNFNIPKMAPGIDDSNRVSHY